MNIIKLDKVTQSDINELLKVWHSAVKNTHDFLSFKEINDIEPDVIKGLKMIEQLYVQKDNDVIISFLGIQDDKIEMLFIDNEYRKQGLGRELIQFAVEQCNVTKVDVNKQNEQAVGFYLKLGFIEFACSELDEQQRPYPILHLKRT